MSRGRGALCLVAVAVIGACDGESRASTSRVPDLVPQGASDRAQPVSSRATTVAFRVPSESAIADPNVLASVRRGRALLRDTRDSLPAQVGNALRCVSCHSDDGTRANTLPWVGVYARYPQYRARSGGLEQLTYRINDCFLRSMNGRALDPASREMTDIVTYLAFLSTGVPMGARVEGQGLRDMKPLPGDTARGAQLYVSACARCHGADGQGMTALIPTPGGPKMTAVPPLWGPRSYNIGAGMARVRTAAAFIHSAMPYDRPGTLADQEAFDLAAFVDSRPRPDYPGKERDWPHGDPPPDVAYPTTAASRRAQGVR